jgi:curved DNA-binding protein CbpA
MSEPIGKFQDYYAILGVDPKSDSETIQRAYTRLAQQYHPNNASTGDQEMFASVNAAYETLSDPELRSAFDKVKGVSHQARTPKFTGLDFFDALGSEAILRAAILCVLYDRRLTEPSAPSLSIRHIELIVEASIIRLNSAVWYLKQRGLMASDDKSSLQITVDGMDFLENKRPSPEQVMAFIKPSAIAESAAHPPQAAALRRPAESPATSKQRDGESVQATLSRALAEIKK